MSTAPSASTRAPRRLAPAALLAALALSAHSAAQVSLEWTGGVLGSQVDYEITAAPGTFFAFLPSFTGGPTPLSIFDPNDPRVLSVGLDLQPLWKFGAIRGTGNKILSFPLPASGTIAGLTLHAQALTFPGATTLVKDLSNATRFALTFTNQTVPTQNDSAFARVFHSLTTLQDGRIYVAGGQAPGAAATIYDRVEFFDPQTQSFVNSPIPLPEPRTHHTATLLNDGTVLLAGGIGQGGVLASARVFQPTTGTYKATPNMASPRALHSATLLSDGRVLVVGGSPQFTFSHPIGFPLAYANAVATTELYDPVANTWSPGPTLPRGLSTHQASPLGDGRVLITGGVENNGVGALPVTTAAAYFYTPGPGGGALASAPPLPSPRQAHAQTPLASGDVLVVGGAQVDFSSVTSAVLGDAFRFDLGGGGWTPVACTIIVRDGKIICVPRPGLPPGYGLIGGLLSLNIGTGGGVPQTQIGIYQPTVNAVLSVGTTLKPRFGVDIAPFDDGRRILVLGSAGGVPADTSADLFTLHP